VRRTPLFLVAALALPFAAACGPEEDGATTPSTAAPTTTTTACAPFGGTEPTSSPDPFVLSSLVGAEVRTGDNGCFDRVVVELQGTGELPGWSARYADGPVTIGESDDPAPIAGEAVLLLRLGAWMRTMDGAGYQGPKDITPTNVEAVQQVLLVDDAEGMSTWAIGLDAPRSYRVSTLTDPPRVVVDIQTEP
jgi:hypothetical protein